MRRLASLLLIATLTGCAIIGEVWKVVGANILGIMGFDSDKFIFSIFEIPNFPDFHFSPRPHPLCCNISPATGMCN